MAYFDHWVKEELKVKYYYRYADDIVILSDSKEQLRSWILAIKVYLTNVLNLKLASYFGWLKYCDSKNLLKKIYQETNIWYSGWNGVKTNIS